MVGENNKVQWIGGYERETPLITDCKEGWNPSLFDIMLICE